MDTVFKEIKVFDTKFILFLSSLILIESSDSIIHNLNKVKNNENNDVPESITKLIKIEKDTICHLKMEAESNNLISGIQINPVNYCNMQCSYCFASNEEQGKVDIMTISTAKDCLNFLTEHCSSKDEIIVTIIGGEPFLNIPAFKTILDYGEELSKSLNKKFRFVTTTNGTILNDDIISMINKYKVNVMVSQDSNNKIINDQLRQMKDASYSQYDILKYDGSI